MPCNASYARFIFGKFFASTIILYVLLFAQKVLFLQKVGVTKKYTMIVSSLGSEMKTKHICPVISIAIMGVDFLLNLIIIDSKGIDIILCMDWLRKYDGVILCAKRAICLTREDGTMVEFMAAISANQITMLSHVKGTLLALIKCQFPAPTHRINV
jgi:hypothetical protein